MTGPTQEAERQSVNRGKSRPAGCHVTFTLRVEKEAEVGGNLTSLLLILIKILEIS